MSVASTADREPSAAAHRSRDQLDREVGPVAPLDHTPHLVDLKTDEAAKGILIRCSSCSAIPDTQSLVTAADVSS